MEDPTVSSKPNKNEEESVDDVASRGEDEESGGGVAVGGEDELDDCNLELSLSLSHSSNKRLKSGERSSSSPGLPLLPFSSPPPLFLSPSPIIPHQDQLSLSFHPLVTIPQAAAAMQQHDLALGLPLAPDPLPSSAAAAVEPVHSASTSNAVNRSATGSGSSRRHPTQARRAGKEDQARRAGKDDCVPPPFLWATDRRATVYSLAHLRSLGIRSITGDVKCKRCDSQYQWKYDLETDFSELAEYIMVRMSTMHDRAPNEWMNPRLPSCAKCGQHDCMKPVVSPKKRSINWLFLLLGKMLGCCTLEQLRYFCKHTKNHRTGAKDRVLYLTYLGLCKQLDPDGPFNPY